MHFFWKFNSKNNFDIVPVCVFDVLTLLQIWSSTNCENQRSKMNKTPIVQATSIPLSLLFKAFDQFCALVLICMPCVAALDVNIHEKQHTNTCRRWLDQITKRGIVLQAPMSIVHKANQQVAKKTLFITIRGFTAILISFTGCINKFYRKKRKKKKWKRRRKTTKQIVIWNILKDEFKWFWSFGVNLVGKIMGRQDTSCRAQHGYPSNKIDLKVCVQRKVGFLN